MKFQVQKGQLLMIGFFGGVLLGTVFANTAGTEFRAEMGIFGSYVGERLPLNGGFKKELFQVVIKQRAWELLVPWLFSLTSLAVPVFVGMAAYYGFSMAVVLSMTTMQMGLSGILGFGASLAPQYLLYIPFWCLFATRCMRVQGQFRQKREIRFHIASLLLFFIIFSAGAWLEAYINPVILQRILINF